jgi:uncharacterized membrane protein
VVSAVGMTQVDKDVTGNFLDGYARWFGAGADGSRAMLSAVATSIITVATVTFSITMLALSQTANQYSPRLLRNFMKDRTTQTALGLFLGVFGYCLVVLRTIRGGDEEKFVPSISVTLGGVLALVAVAFFVVFIHHIASSLQPSTIMEATFLDTSRAIEALFPKTDADDSESNHTEPIEAKVENGAPIRATVTGYLTAISTDDLVRDAVRHRGCIRAAVQVGEFVLAGQIVAVFYPDENGHDGKELVRRFQFERHRAIEQDPAFGIQQFVDIAMRALSPGINDPTTAVMAIEYISAILAQLAGSSLGNRQYFDKEGRLRVEIPAPTFAEFVDLCLGAIRAATTDKRVLISAANAVAKAGERTPDESRKRDLARLLEQLARSARGVGESDDRSAVDKSIHKVHTDLIAR